MEPSLYEILGLPSWNSFIITNAVIHCFDAVVCALIARNRGRDVRGWTLAALAGGFVTMAVLLLLPRPKPPATGPEPVKS